MSASKTAALCALIATTAIAAEPTHEEARDVSTMAFGKGTRNSATNAGAKPELLRNGPPATLRPLQKVVDVRGHGRRQGPPMPGLSFFTACRAAVRKCLVVAPRSVLACVFSMPPSDGAMTRRCMLWIRRRNRAIALLMGRREKGRGKTDEDEDEEDEEEEETKGAAARGKPIGELETELEDERH